MCAQRRLISLGIRRVWSESSLCAQLVAKNPSFFHADSEDWSDWADAQADLSLRWAHMSFCWFCHEAAQFQLSAQWVRTYCMVKGFCKTRRSCVSNRRVLRGRPTGKPLGQWTWKFMRINIQWTRLWLSNPIISILVPVLKQKINEKTWNGLILSDLFPLQL